MVMVTKILFLSLIFKLSQLQALMVIAPAATWKAAWKFIALASPAVFWVSLLYVTDGAGWDDPHDRSLSIATGWYIFTLSIFMGRGVFELFRAVEE